MSTHQVITGPGQTPIKAWTQGVPVEPAALSQWSQLGSLPIVHSHIAVMPAQSDLVEVVHTLKQRLCVKG